MFKYLCVSKVLKFVVLVLNAITMFKMFWLGLLKCIIFWFKYMQLLVKFAIENFFNGKSNKLHISEFWLYF